MAEDPDYLRMELHSVLEGSAQARAFFENRWRPFAEFIAHSLAEVGRQTGQRTPDARVAGLMFQGMVREALHEKCILESPQVKDISLEALTDRLVELFLRAVLPGGIA